MWAEAEDLEVSGGLPSIGERRRQGQNVLRREARYGGGRYPFGYEPYQVDAYRAMPGSSRGTTAAAKWGPWSDDQGDRAG